jgi:hypothetical protein
LQEIAGPYLPAAGELRGWVSELELSPLFGAAETFSASFEQLFDAHGLAERVGTISYVARLPAGERAALLERVRALGASQPESPFPFRYRTVVRVCRAATVTTL